MEMFWEDVSKILAGYYDQLVLLFPRLVLALVILLITVYFSGMVSKALIKRMWRKADDPLLGSFLIRLGRGILMIFGLVLVFGVLGLTDTVTKVLAGAGITAFIVGFAFKDLGENFLAGFLLAFKRPFSMGDTIESNGVSGRVTGMSLREITIKTADGKDIYIPNSLILKTPLINFTQDRMLRMDITIHLGYEGELSRPVETILGILRKNPLVMQESNVPGVSILQFTPGDVVFRIMCWINTSSPAASIPSIRSEIIKSLVESLDAAGYSVKDVKSDQNLNQF